MKLPYLRVWNELICQLKLKIKKINIKNVDQDWSVSANFMWVGMNVKEIKCKIFQNRVNITNKANTCWNIKQATFNQINLPFTVSEN